MNTTDKKESDEDSKAAVKKSPDVFYEDNFWASLRPKIYREDAPWSFPEDDMSEGEAEAFGKVKLTADVITIASDEAKSDVTTVKPEEAKPDVVVITPTEPAVKPDLVKIVPDGAKLTIEPAKSTGRTRVKVRVKSKPGFEADIKEPLTVKPETSSVAVETMVPIALEAKEPDASVVEEAPSIVSEPLPDPIDYDEIFAAIQHEIKAETESLDLAEEKVKILETLSS